MTSDELRYAIYAEITAGMKLLRAPPESIALAESLSSPHDISAAFERCGAPLAYIAAVGAYRNESPDEETLVQLVFVNKLVAEIADGANTPEIVRERLGGDRRVSLCQPARNA